MAVTTRSKTKKRPARKAASRSNGHAAKGNGHAVAKEYEVITLRIDRQHKSKLLDHCAKRAKKEGRQMSFNRAIIEWIQGL